MDISEETKENFRTSSIYHILAVSGTHVRFFANRYNYYTWQIKSLKKENKRNFDTYFMHIYVYNRFYNVSYKSSYNGKPWNNRTDLSIEKVIW